MSIQGRPGFRTFWLLPIIEGSCGCAQGKNCKNLGKHPPFGWNKDEISTLDAKTPTNIRGVGVRTGVPSGIVVIDCDHAQAVSDWRSVVEEKDYPETYEVTTGRGMHFYYKAPSFAVKNSTHIAGDGSGIDVRGEGGFIVTEGSPHKSGSKYAGNGKQIAELPESVWQAFAKKERAVATVPAIELDTLEARALEQECIAHLKGKARVSKDGSGDHLALFLTAQEVVKKYRMPKAKAIELLVNHYNPRCDDRWSLQELTHKVEDAITKGKLDFTAAEELKNFGKVKARVNLVAIDGGKNSGESYGDTTYEFGDFQENTKLERIPLINAAHYLGKHPAWEGVLAFDLFKDDIIVRNPAPCPTPIWRTKKVFGSEDVTSTHMWFQKLGMDLDRSSLKLALAAAAQERSFHPIREYLDALPPPDLTIIDGLAARLFGEVSDLSQLFLRKFLIAAVRRVRVPGTKVDSALVLYSQEGHMKSQFVETLFGKEYVLNSLPQVDSKDAKAALSGNWCVEIAEMQSFKGRDYSAVKNFLSTSEDKFRRAYAERDLPIPRQCVFICTTNDPRIFQEGQGRRFWPITLSEGWQIPWQWVAENRDALWSAANALETSGEQHWLSREEEQTARKRQSDYREEDSIEAIVASVIKDKSLTTTEIMKEVFPDDIEQSIKNQKRLRAVLLQLNYTQKLMGIDRRRIWVLETTKEES